MRHRMKVIYCLAGAIVLIIAAAICLSLFWGTGSHVVGGADELLFITSTDSQGNIYRMSPDTNKPTNITNNAKNYLNAAWSPDGSKIVYTECVDSKWLTYTMNRDGKDVQPVAGLMPFDLVSEWSPDGRYLLLTSRRDVDQEVYCLEVSTGKAINLSCDPSEDSMPVWSPDGKKIAFISNRDKQGWNSLFQLYIMDVATGGVTRVPTNNKSARYPVWLPNSTDLAVSLVEENELTRVYITDVSGSKLNKLEVGSGEVTAQACSADGARLLVDDVVYENDIVKHKPMWINLKDNTTEMLVHEVSAEAGSYSRKVSCRDRIVVKASDSGSSVQYKKESLALTHATLIDGNGGEPVKDALVLIDGGVVKYAGRYDQGQIPDSYRVIDLNGRYILPGFIDTHAHYTYDAYNSKVWAKQGVTTVRDLGSSMDKPLFDMRDNINARPEYARVIMAGPMITVPNGYPYGSWAMRVTSPEDAAEKTAKLIGRGVDVIKVALETGEPFGQKSPILSYEELKAIVDVAHSKGIKVSAHVSVLNAGPIEMAIKAGVDDFAHNWMIPVDDGVLIQMKDAGRYLVPTQEVLKYNEAVSQMNLRAYVSLGGQVAFGNDYGGDPYGTEMELGMPMKEIHSMLDSGMTPMQVIVSATRNSAVVCGREKSLGTVEAGKIADALILNGNPLEDMDNLKKVRMVIKDGTIISENAD